MYGFSLPLYVCVILLCMAGREPSFPFKFKLKHKQLGKPHGSPLLLGHLSHKPANSTNAHKLKQYWHAIHQLNPSCKQDILNFFKQQEIFRVVKVNKFKSPDCLREEAKLNLHLNAEKTPTANFNIDNNASAETMSNSSLNSNEEDSTVSFKMGSGESKSSAKHDTDSQRQIAQTKHANENGSSTELREPKITTNEEVSYIPTSTFKEDLHKIKMKLATFQPGTMEYLFTDLEYKMKVDNLKILERVNAVSLNTSATKATCDQTKVETDEISKSLEVTQEVQDQQQVTIKSHTRELQNIYDKMSYLEGIVEKQNQEILLLKQANEEQIARGMKSMIYIHNIVEEEDEKDADTMRIVKDFFRNEMGISNDINVSKATREGPSKKKDKGDEGTGTDFTNNYSPPPRSILLNLANIGDKGTIYNHVGNLKGKKNKFNKAYVVSDKLPAGQQENKRFQNDVVKRIKSIPGEKPNHKFKKGKLYVNGKLYKPSVTPPKVNEIVSPDNQDDINAVILQHGETIAYEGCTFTAFSQEVRSIQDVQKGYVRMKQMYPEALHISNAYRLPGTDIDSEGMADDGEHGCGRLILKLLTEWNIYCRAIYLVRRYGGVHLGTKRFGCMTEAVKSCVARSSFNSITGTNQYPWEEYVANRQPSIRGRNMRGRGRTTPPPRAFTSNYTSPNKLYSEASTPN